MTDNRLVFSTGFYPTPEKKCTRCGRIVECPELFDLCDLCHKGDKLADFFSEDRILERDRQSEIEFARYG